MDFAPKGYFYQDLLFVKSSWMCDLLENQILPKEFLQHPTYTESDVTAILRDGKVPKNDQNEWEIISVDKISRLPDSFVCQLPPVSLNSSQSSEKPCFAEVVQYVTQANFANNWREAFKKFPNTLIGDSILPSHHNTKYVIVILIFYF